MGGQDEVQAGDGAALARLDGDPTRMRAGGAVVPLPFACGGAFFGVQLPIGAESRLLTGRSAR